MDKKNIEERYSIQLSEWVYKNLEINKPKQQSVEDYANYVLKDWLIAKINGDLR